MRQHVRPANLVTSVSLTLGFLALLVVPHRVGLATTLVLLAAGLDGLDGALARRSGGDHTFGAQLDSLADLVCFCVVPAFTLHHAVVSGPSAPAVLAPCAVVVAGAWRLARFPLVQQQGHFVGLPTPVAGGLIMLLVLWAPVVVALLGAVVLSALMVSSIRFPTVLAAATTVRPGHRAHALRRRFGRRPALVPRVLARARRRRLQRPIVHQGRAYGRAGQVLNTLRRGGRRRRGRP